MTPDASVTFVLPTNNEEGWAKAARAPSPVFEPSLLVVEDHDGNGLLVPPADVEERAS